jgi:hypothetical protein
MMSKVIMTMTPNIMSIDPPGGWGGGGALPLAIAEGRRKGGMKVGFVSSGIHSTFDSNMARVSNGTVCLAQTCAAANR